MKSILWVSLPEASSPEEANDIAKFVKEEFQNEEIHILVTVQPTKIEAYGMFCMKLPLWIVRFGMWAKRKKK